MIFTFSKIWGGLSYIVALVSASVLVGHRLPRKKYFILRSILTCIIIVVVKFAYDEIFVYNMDIQQPLLTLVRTINSFILFLFVIIGMKICFKCSWWAVLFCGTAGYCLEHMTQRSYLIISDLIQNKTTWVGVVLLTMITALVYVAFYFIALRKKNHQNIMVDNKIQIAVATFVVLITIFVNAFALTLVRSNRVYEIAIYLYIFSIVTCLLALFLEFSLLSKKNIEIERDRIKQMLHQEREQYYIEKEIIDVLNIKCHDLKHQISAFEGRVNHEELENIKKAVNMYDSVFKTSNVALDTVLTRKSLLCERKNIKITCMADGAKLGFMSEVDIYSLFGNILDNAIEATESLTDIDNRVISLTITARNEFIFIHSENYFNGSIEFEQGMPKTTKKDKMYHGFGMKSIEYLIQKYNGDFEINTTGDVFALDIMLPIAQKI